MASQVNALSATSTIVAFLNFGFTLLGTAQIHHTSPKGRDEVLLESGRSIRVLSALNDRLQRSLRTSTGCLTKEEQGLEDLSHFSSIVADDLLIRLDRVGITDEPAQEQSGQEFPKSFLVKEDLDTLSRRLSTFKLELETKIVPFLKEFIDIFILSESDGFDSLNLDVKDMVEMLLGNLIMFPQHLEFQRSPAKEQNIDMDEQDPAPRLGVLQITDGQQTKKPHIPPWDPAKDAYTDKESLLQDFIPENLSSTSMRDREEEVDEAHLKTFEWIFTDENSRKVKSNFLQWLKGGNEGVYWINGKAGSGKSTLMRFIYHHKRTVEQLQIWAKEKPLAMAGFFFWTSGSYEQRSQVGLFRYILFQLLEQHRSFIATIFPELWKKFWAASTQDRIKTSISWTLQSLMQGLRLFLEQSVGKMNICLLVDGLDEFDGDHREIIQIFKGIMDSAHNNVKVCVSSRPWAVFEEAFNNIPSLKLQDLTLSDMNQYVDEKFIKDPRIQRIVRMEPEIGQQLVEEIVIRADGIFLWVILVVRTLLGQVYTGEKATDLQGRLSVLPTGLDALFQHMVFDIQTEDRVKEALRIFQLVRAREIVCNFTRDQSASSLTLWELALAYDEGEDDLALRMSIQRANYAYDYLSFTQKNLAMQAVLAFFDKDSATSTNFLAQKKLTYLHRTVRDFLTFSGVWNNVVSKTRFENFDPHLCLLQSYIKQLKLPLEEPERHRQLDEWWPDIVLALTHARYVPYGPEHIMSIALISELDSVLRRYWLPKKTDSNDNWARSAFGSYEARNETVYQDPFLCLATRFGLCQYVDSQLSTGDIAHKDGQPILKYAIEFLISRRHTIYPLSSPLLVQIILHHGANPNQLYTAISPRRETTSWLEALECLREAHRRGWIEYYDINPDGTARWVQILKYFLEYGADPNAEIKVNRWDPAATALEIVGMVFDVYGSAEVGILRDLLIEKGAKQK